MRLRPGVVPVLLSALGFASLPLWAKLGFRAGLDPVTLLAARFALAAPILLAAAALRDPAALRRSPKEVALLLAQGAVGYGTPALLAFLGFRVASGAVVVAAYFTFPLWVTLGGALFLGERLRARQLVALALAVGGTALAAGLVGAPRPGATPAGAAYGLAAALAYAVYLISAQKLLARIDPLAIAGYSMLGCALVFPAARLAAGGPSPEALWSLLAVAVAMALAATAVPLGLLLTGLRRVGASRGAVIGSVEPVFAAGLLYLTLAERLSAWQGAGILAVAGGVALVAGGPPARPPAGARPGACR